MEKLRVDDKKGLNGGDLPQRTLHFGNNWRPPPKRTPCCVLFKEQLKDTMIQILLVCAVVSITIEMAFAESPEDLSHNWIEGAAIIGAVALVTGVSSVVDWKKEG